MININLFEKNQLSTWNAEPLEISFQFPKEPNSIIGKMSISIGDRFIQAKVMEKYKAQQKYDDATAAGNFSGMLKESQLDMH